MAALRRFKQIAGGFQVDELRTTTRDTRAELIRGVVATYRLTLGLPHDSESDDLWVGWITRGERTLEQAFTALRNAAG